MESSHIVASVFGGLLVTLVACSSSSSAVDGDATDSGARGDDGSASIDSGSSGTSTTPDAAGNNTGPPVVVGPGNDRCGDATAIPLSAANLRVDLEATTTGAKHDIDGGCGTADGADVFYSFAVSKRVFVYADTFGATWNTALFLLSSTCEPITTPIHAGQPVCNDDACGSQQSQIVALLQPGTYRLGLSGVGGAQGDATIHFEWTLAGSGTIAPLPQGHNVISGTTAGSEGNIDEMSPDCLAAAAENSYWWARCPSDTGGTLAASTCGGTTWESIVEAQIPRGASSYSCNLDGCGLQASLSVAVPAGAGLGVLSVDGQGGNDVGAYQLTVDRP